MKLLRFVSNLTAPPESDLPSLPYKGRGWSVEYGPELRLADGAIYYYTWHGEPTIPKHIVIKAKSEETARNTIELILAASCLINDSCKGLTELSNGRLARYDKKVDFEKFTDDPDNSPIINTFQFACLIAARASFRKSYQYALMKYRLSQQIFNTRTDYLDPANWMPIKFVYNSSSHHVRCAEAITLGYSIIEELGLEVRAHANKPSFIDGKWNPVVKTELEKRLVEAGVNLEEKAIWTLRDTSTKIERKRRISKAEKAPWAYSKVRDREVELVDAIANASWLRSKASAHRLSKLSSSLNYYDVSNLHYLSRRLLLESLRLWRCHASDIE